MKSLSYGRMAEARIRKNTKSYLGLGLGIFLSVFLLTTVFLALYGVILKKGEDRKGRVGNVDAIVLDEPEWTDEEIGSLGIFEAPGHVGVAAVIESSSLYFGWMDKTAEKLMAYRIEEGRMPESEGEIAAERSAIIALELPTEIGSEVTLNLTPIDGISEEKSFTLVGILGERSSFLGEREESVQYSDNPIIKLPSIIGISSEKLETGRLAIHRVMELVDNVKQKKQRAVYNEVSYGHRILAADQLGYMTSPVDSLLFPSLIRDGNTIVLLLVIIFLGISLLIGCSVAISGSLETLLTERREETGILRAIGATKKQIRRIFGRDAIILCLLVMPLAILSACGFTYVLAERFRDMLRFGFSFWLILPIVLLSLLTVWAAQSGSLKRAGSQMPMSVIRDTEVLRHGKTVKSIRNYRIDKLLAKRRRKLFPGRDRSSILFMAVMAISCGLLFTAAVSEYYGSGEKASFQVCSLNYFSFYDDYFSDFSGHMLTLPDIAQIRELPHVKGTETEGLLQMTLLADGEYDIWDDSVFQVAAGHSFYNSESKAVVQKLLHTELNPVPRVVLFASDAEIQKLSETLPEINLDAIDRGEEVIVEAPSWWEVHDGYGAYMASEAKNPGDTLIRKNDYFYSGQELDLALLYIKNAIPSVAEVGAVLGNTDKTDVKRMYMRVGGVIEEEIPMDLIISDIVLVTSFQGLLSMDMPALGVYSVNIYTDGELTEAEEQNLELGVNSILRRSGNYVLINCLRASREAETRKRELILLFTALSIVFFAVSVGITVSGTSRKLQSDIRSIGMLRAVGAEEQDLVKSYLRPLLMNAGFALAIAEVLYLVFLLGGLIVNHAEVWKTAVFSCVGMLMFIAVCVLSCSVLIRKKIQLITKKSIIDNIREL